ncbi:MAG: hypothetical protein ABIO39_05520 [Caulobacteraceae bacterium]
MKRTFAVAAATLALGCAGLTTKAEAASASCDRACLTGVLTAYLNAMVAHKVTSAPVATNVRFTEDTQDMKLGDGLWKTITGLGTYRQDFIDVRRGVAGAHVVVKEGDNEALLALRLKVVNRHVTEVETQVTHDAKQGSLFDLTALKTASPTMNRMLTGADKTSRDEIVHVATYYPAGLKAGSFAQIDSPFAADTYRIENGVYTAGPACTRSETCKSVKAQPLGPGRTGFQERLMAVDEDLGVAWLRMSWARSGGKRLVVYEAFKVTGGKLNAIEAFMKEMPVASTSGWD